MDDLGLQRLTTQQSAELYDLHSDDPRVQKRARQARSDLYDGPTVRYVITVPESQMITAQEHLSPAPLTLDMQFWPDGTDNGTHPLPLAGIWKAVQAVNDDLTLRDLPLRLPGPNHLIC